MPGDFLIDDLPTMIAIDEFATTAVVITEEAAGLMLNGIFTAPFADPFGVASNSPEFVIATPCPDEIKVTDRLEIEGVEYRIKSIQPDSTGVTKFELNEV